MRRKIVSRFFLCQRQNIDTSSDALRGSLRRSKRFGYNHPKNILDPLKKPPPIFKTKIIGVILNSRKNPKTN